MAYIGNVVTSFNVATQNINNDAITTEKIADGAILNADVNSAAAIAGTKISPDFGSQNIATTGLFSHALGAAAAPTITFTGDPNTGIYSPGADQVAISTNGTGRLFVDASGNIAAGTSATSNFGATARSFDINSAGGIANLYVKTGTVSGGLMADAGNGYVQVWTATSHPIAFNIAFSEKMRLDTSGRLGLGTSSPGFPIEVKQTGVDSTIWGYNVAQFADATANNTGLRIATNTSTSGLTQLVAATNSAASQFGFWTYNGSAWGERVRISSTGSVGIGTTSPEARLTTISTATLNGVTNCTFRSSDNVTSSFYVGHGSGGISNLVSDSALGFGFNSGGTYLERARIDTSGRLLVGTSTARSIDGNIQKLQVEGAGAAQATLASFVFGASNSFGPTVVISKSRSDVVAGVAVVSNGDTLGTISFNGADGTDLDTSGASISAQVDGTPGANDMPGRLVLSTTADGASSSTERMRIAQDGQINLRREGFDSQAGYSQAGIYFNTFDSGSVGFARSSAPPVWINRLTNDGTLIDFAQATTSEGSISVSGTTVSYNGAHLSRWSQLPDGAEREEILRGTVLSNLDEMCGWGEEDNEQLNRMKVSDVEGDVNVAGVFQAWDDDDDTYTDDFYCAMTGDFIIRIAEGTPVHRGQLLMSAGDGTAKPQDNDIIRSKTIAKVTSNHVTCTYEDGSYCVPCVLMAC